MEPATPADPGEDLMVLERVIVSPGVGVFHPLEVAEVIEPGHVVEAGQPIGTIERSGITTRVMSPFRGILMGMLAHTGERVREGQPVAWLRAAAA